VWSIDDDILALYLHRYGTEHLGRSLAELAEERGIPLGSLRMRIANFKALDGAGGLGRWAEQSREIHEWWGSLSEPELRVLVLASP
jgi:hypothetical protein